MVVELINPPGDDWQDRLFARLRATRERIARDECAGCGGERLSFRHWAYPSECPGTSR